MRVERCRRIEVGDESAQLAILKPIPGKVAAARNLSKVDGAPAKARPDKLAPGRAALAAGVPAKAAPVRASVGPPTKAYPARRSAGSAIPAKACPVAVAQGFSAMLGTAMIEAREAKAAPLAAVTSQNAKMQAAKRRIPASDVAAAYATGGGPDGPKRSRT